MRRMLLAGVLSTLILGLVSCDKSNMDKKKGSKRGSRSRLATTEQVDQTQ